MTNTQISPEALKQAQLITLSVIKNAVESDYAFDAYDRTLTRLKDEVTEVSALAEADFDHLMAQLEEWVEFESPNSPVLGVD